MIKEEDFKKALQKIAKNHEDSLWQIHLLDPNEYEKVTKPLLAQLLISSISATFSVILDLPMAFMEKTVCTYLMESGYTLDDRWNVLHKDFYSKLEELCK